jgi:hypothetical protein
VAAALRQFVAERIACGDWPYAELLDDRGA